MEQLTAEAREIGVSVAHLGRNVKGKLLAAVIEGAAASADDKVEHMTASICSTFRHLPVEVNPMHACMHACMLEPHAIQALRMQVSRLVFMAYGKDATVSKQRDNPNPEVADMAATFRSAFRHLPVEVNPMHDTHAC